MMILKSLRLGTNDLDKAREFYDATFAALGVGPCQSTPEWPIVLWDVEGFKFMLGPARDGNPATHANGGTVLFEAPDEATVRAWHAAGLAHGGTCEGAPEAKPQARGAFGAYMRDPDGNKLGIYCGLKVG
ncbi:VOC family protein [Novosphingobium sp. KA1]|uniref:VOC family protein n=1 Tax=Novosphingobium sp. (strain KA1) TaxID=164608 RepID=UPI001F5CE7C9|nr:VOC family protein [Novosphingobium sp. KA1]